jgi:hypothetical protein
MRLASASHTAVSKPLLRYQRERPLDQVSGYGTGMQVRTRAGPPAYLALSATELAVYFDEPDRSLHYDLAGRLVKFSTPDRYYRRGLSHRVLQTRKRTPEEGGGIERKLLPPAAADELIASAYELVGALYYELKRGETTLDFAKPDEVTALAQIFPLLEQAGRFDTRAAQADAERFHDVYGHQGILPPDQYNALVLQATEGCAYAGCLFCELYRGDFFVRKTPAQFRKHVRAALAYHGRTLRARRSIFLGEANAMTVPHENLVEMLKVIQEHVELPPPDQPHVPASWWLGHERRFDGVNSFVDAFMGPHRSVEEFAQLRQLGLRRVYIGMESGDDELLQWLCKPATADSIAQTVRALKDAGISVGVIALLGAGGHLYAEQHVRETVQLLNELPLSRGDYIYFSPIVIYPCSRYAEQTRALDVMPLTPAELREQEMAIRAGLRFNKGRGRPYVARYELETFVY